MTAPQISMARSSLRATSSTSCSSLATEKSRTRAATRAPTSSPSSRPHSSSSSRPPSPGREPGGAKVRHALVRQEPRPAGAPELGQLGLEPLARASSTSPRGPPSRAREVPCVAEVIPHDGPDGGGQVLLATSDGPWKVTPRIRLGWCGRKSIRTARALVAHPMAAPAAGATIQIEVEGSMGGG